jgi:hypothetical protein
MGEILSRKGQERENDRSKIIGNILEKKFRYAKITTRDTEKEN